ncbi:Crp/Fnr family transcriptional regulator, partial [Nocardiopsis alkaliphila]|uniref:Crp/Fnr family transcriptional regulator n=1 Tax=Nocardiopsis alkaliphila TaxID=225762 RepID=UPI001EF9ED89
MHRYGFGALLADDQWDRLVHGFPVTSFVPRQVLLAQGTLGKGIHLLLNGRVRVESVYADGTADPLAFRSRGEIFGESVLAGGRLSRNATVTALSGCTTIYTLAERFQGRLKELGFAPFCGRAFSNGRSRATRSGSNSPACPPNGDFPPPWCTWRRWWGSRPRPPSPTAPRVPAPGASLRFPCHSKRPAGLP